MTAEHNHLLGPSHGRPDSCPACNPPDAASSGDSAASEDEPVHRIGAFTGGEHNVGVAWCGYLVNHPNTPQQIGKFAAARHRVTCPSCLAFYGETAPSNGSKTGADNA